MVIFQQILEHFQNIAVFNTFLSKSEHMLS